MQNRGADPSIRTEDYDPYLSPGKKLPIEVALEEDEIRGKLKALEKKYAKARTAAKHPVHPPHLPSFFFFANYVSHAIKGTGSIPPPVQISIACVAYSMDDADTHLLMRSEPKSHDCLLQRS